MADQPHQRFTVSTTAYLRNLSSKDLRGQCFAIHFQRPPRKTEGGTSIGLCFPMMLMAGYLENPEGVAQQVAAILEAHWPAEQD